MGRIGSYASLYYAQDMADPERGRFSQNVSETLTDIGTKLLFFRLEINKLEDADLAAKQKDPGARQVRAVAARPARLPPAPALRRAGEAAAREVRRRPRRLDRACSTRPSRGCASRRRRGADRAADPRQAVRARTRAVRKDAAKSFGKVHGRQYRGLLADHQHAGQGQGDRGPLAQVSAPAVVAQPRQPGRGRGGRRAGRRR